MRVSVTLIFCLVLMQLSAQMDTLKRQAKLDSLSLKLKADSLKLYRFNTFRPYANIDNRNSFIRKRPVNVKGGQIGIVFKEYHAFGLGYYTITQQSQRAFRTADNSTSNTVNQYLSLNYTTLFYQFQFLDKRFFELDLPFEIGYGKYTMKFENINTQDVYRNVSQPIVPLGAGVQLVLKPLRWIGFSTMGGYRYVGERNPSPNFNGFYYSFGLWLDIRQAYRDIRFYGFMKRKYKEQVKKLQQNAG